MSFYVAMRTPVFMSVFANAGAGTKPENECDGRRAD